MGRTRTVNHNLPRGMYVTKGVYYFINHQKKWIKLGKTLSEALTEYYSILPFECANESLQEVFERYMLEVSPTKAESSYESDVKAMRQLLPVMGHIRAEDLTPRHIYKYITYRSKKAPVRVNREISLLSHVYSTAIFWGIVDTNPCRDIKRNRERPRTRYVTDNELSAFTSILPLWMQLYVELKYLTGLRQSDLLTLRFTAITERGLLVRPRKTEKTSRHLMLIEWTKALSNVVNSIKILQNKHKEQKYFFVNRDGNPYTASGFQSIWQSYKNKALMNGLLDESFQERDIRAKTASDIGSLSDAKLLLGHESDKTTAKYYSRLPTSVKPLH